MRRALVTIANAEQPPRRFIAGADAIDSQFDLYVAGLPPEQVETS